MRKLFQKPKVFGMTYPFRLGDVIQCDESLRIGTIVGITPFTTYTLLRVMWSDTGTVTNIDADNITLMISHENHKFV